MVVIGLLDVDLWADVTSPDSVDVLVVFKEIGPWEVDFSCSDSVVDLWAAVLTL